MFFLVLLFLAVYKVVIGIDLACVILRQFHLFGLIMMEFCRLPIIILTICLSLRFGVSSGGSDGGGLC